MGAGDRLVFLADLDGWPHLYSIPESGGAPLLLTPGRFMAEHVAMTPDHRPICVQREHGHHSRTTTTAAISSACRSIAPRRWR